MKFALRKATFRSLNVNCEIIHAKVADWVDPPGSGTGAHFVNVDFEMVYAEVAELVDAHDSKSCSFGSVGSIPTFGTKKAPGNGAFFII